MRESLLYKLISEIQEKKFADVVYFIIGSIRMDTNKFELKNHHDQWRIQDFPGGERQPIPQPIPLAILFLKVHEIEKNLDQLWNREW